MIVALTSKINFQEKLKGILDTAKLKEQTAIVIMTDRSWHMEIFDFMLKHPKVGRIKQGGSTYFIIKEMRIELKPIDFYI